MEKLRANRDGIRSIARRHGASNVRIFGSVARGEDGPESRTLDMVGAAGRPVMR